MRLILLLLAVFLPLSCKSVPDGPAEPAEPAPDSVAEGMVSGEDVAAVNQFFKANKTNAMIPAAAAKPNITAANSHFVVDLDGQRAYFYVDKKLTAATALASGRKYYRTETGDYTIGQKNRNHRSNSYGNFVSSTGRTMVNDVKNGFDPTPVGGRFQGSLMKYFMRFDHKGKPTAMGFHRGVLPGYPASHGCVRLPEKSAAWFFANVPPGTPVHVRGTKYGVRYGASQGRPKRSPKVHASLKEQPAPAPPADPGPEAVTEPAPATVPEEASPEPAPSETSTVPDSPQVEVEAATVPAAPDSGS